MIRQSLTDIAQGAVIRPEFIHRQDDRPELPHNHFTDEIPVISLAGVDEVGGRRVQILKKIVKACEEWGIFQVVDHGVDTQLISETTRLSREFFAFSADEKFRFDMSGGKKGGFLVSSHLRGDPVKDWRELMIFITYPVESRDYTRWPEKPEGWRATIEEYSERLMELARKLLEVLSEGMGLEKEALSEASVEMEQKMLINFYPKCPQPDLALGLHPHTDPGTITILQQDQVGGLQATRDGGKTWLTIKPVEGAFVINLGDHAHYLSNGRYKSAEHRAVVNSNRSRLSIATFQNPKAEATVYPLALRKGDKAVMEEPIPYSEMYRRKMQKDIQRNKPEQPQKLEEKPIDQILA